MKRLPGVCAALGVGFVAFALDPARDILLSWPEPNPSVVDLAREIGAAAVLVPFNPGSTYDRFASACSQAGILPVAELRQEGSVATLRERARLALKAGFGGLAYQATGNEAELRRFIEDHANVPQLVFVDPSRANWRLEPAYAVWTQALWPGTKRPEPTSASATESPWIDANLWLISWLRARFPERPPILGQRPDPEAGVAEDQYVPNSTVEVALAEARIAGGNWILALPERYRQALIEGELQAIRDWRSLARTIQFLREHLGDLQASAGLRILALAGELEETGEILNLLFRHNATPAVEHVASPRLSTLLASGGYSVVVAANLEPPEPLRAPLLEFAKRGGTLVVAPSASERAPWWSTAAQPGKSEAGTHGALRLGQGRLIVYPEPIVDVHEFALDVIAALNWKVRDLRIWGAPTILGLVHRSTQGGLTLGLIDYGHRWTQDHDPDFLIQVYGRFAKAELLVPERSASIPLSPRVRGELTEIELRDLRYVGLIQMQRGEE